MPSPGAGISSPQLLLSSSEKKDNIALLQNKINIMLAPAGALAYPG
jgi:hypothetical protein